MSNAFDDNTVTCDHMEHMHHRNHVDEEHGSPHYYDGAEVNNAATCVTAPSDTGMNYASGSKVLPVHGYGCYCNFDQDGADDQPRRARASCTQSPPPDGAAVCSAVCPVYDIFIGTRMDAECQSRQDRVKGVYDSASDGAEIISSHYHIQMNATDRDLLVPERFPTTTDTYDANTSSHVDSSR